MERIDAESSEEDSLVGSDLSEEEAEVLQHFRSDSDASVSDSDEEDFVVQEEAHSGNDDESEVMFESIEMGGMLFEWDSIMDPPKEKPLFSKEGFTCNEDLRKRQGVHGATPVQLFFMIFTIQFWGMVVTNTNLYAEASGAQDWEPIDLFEILNWIIILLVATLVRTPRVTDLFTKSNPIFHNNFVSSLGMTKYRWMQIRKYLHISDPQSPYDGDPYYKIRPLIDALKQTFVLYIPFSEFYSVDEMTAGYQGRTPYGITKRTKEKKVPKGFQMVTLSTDKGYVIDFEFDRENVEDKYTNISATGNRVMRILKVLSLLYLYAHVFMDNRFSTPILFYLTFSSYKFYCTGTWRKNYGIPSLIFLSKLKSKAAIEIARSEGIRIICAKNEFGARGEDVYFTGCSFYDNAPVHFLTTGFYDYKIEVGGSKKVERWDITHKYNKRMCGNDVADALLVAFHSYIRSPKYWVRLFHFLFDLGLDNMYLLYREGFDNGFDHSKFLSNLIFGLLGYVRDLSSRLPVGRPIEGSSKKRKMNSNARSIHKSNFGEQIERLDGVGHLIAIGDRGRCKWCSLHDRRSEVTSFCSKCGLHLCKDTCFEAYHTEIDL